MPDLALMPSNRADDHPVWIMDPKHSERSSYSLKKYKKVAKRYHLRFGPQRTWIIEYYSRDDIRGDNPLVLGDHMELIRDVSPRARGYALLVGRLREFYGVPETTMAVVDVSASFFGSFGHVKEDLTHLQANGTSLSDDIIWFSDKASLAHGCLDALDQGTLEPPDSIANGGTQFAPVVQLLQQFHDTHPAPIFLRIYTDRGSSDVKLDEAIKSLQQRGVVNGYVAVDFAPYRPSAAS
jgi:hypothetical protein